MHTCGQCFVLRLCFVLCCLFQILSFTTLQLKIVKKKLLLFLWSFKGVVLVISFGQNLVDLVPLPVMVLVCCLFCFFFFFCLLVLTFFSCVFLFLHLFDCLYQSLPIAGSLHGQCLCLHCVSLLSSVFNCFLPVSEFPCVCMQCHLASICLSSSLCYFCTFLNSYFNFYFVLNLIAVSCISIQSLKLIKYNSKLCLITVS